MRAILHLIKALQGSHKGRQILAFVTLLTAASALTQSALLLLTRYPQFIEESAYTLHTEDVGFLTHGIDNQVLLLNILEDERVRDLESTPTGITYASFPYATSEKESLITFRNNQDPSRISENRHLDELSPEKKAEAEHPLVYLPYFFKYGGYYRAGDLFSLRIHEQVYPFTVAGFSQNILLGTSSLGLLEFILDMEDYNGFLRQTEGICSGHWTKVLLDSRQDVESFTSDMVHLFHRDNKQHTLLAENCEETEECSDLFYEPLISFNLNQAIRSRILISYTIAIVFITMSVACTIISLICLRFLIQITIENTTKNIGIMKAIGYSDRQIIIAFHSYFMIQVFLAIILGQVYSYASLPFISMLLSSESGVFWQQNYDFPISLISACILAAIVSYRSLSTSFQTRNVEPMTSILGKNASNPFKKNYLPLAKTKSNRPLLFAIKNILYNPTASSPVFVTLILSTLLCLSILILYSNIRSGNPTIKEASTGYSAHIIISLEEEADNYLLREKLRTEPEVAYADFMDAKLVHIQSKQAIALINENFDYLKDRLIYEGRAPRHENEISMNGLFAKELGLEIGDFIPISGYQGEEKFLITGLAHGSQFLGRHIQITCKGFDRLGPHAHKGKIGVFFWPEISQEEIDAFTNYLAEREDISQAVNLAKQNYIRQTNFRYIARIVSITALLVMALIIFATIHIVVKTVRNRTQRDYSVRKFIGYTYSSLKNEIILSYAPAILGGCLIGSVLSILSLKPISKLLFSLFGILKVELALPPEVILPVNIILSAYSFAICSILSRSLQNVDYYELITEDARFRGEK